MSATLLATSSTAYAAESVGFAVKSVIPENQRDVQKTYFDLRMKPEQKQDLKVEIFNQDTVAMEVSISAISASTNANGLIDYHTPNVRDESLKIPFSDIATVKEPKITIQPQQSQMVTVSVAMPKESYDGVILGGIVITKTPEKKQDQVAADDKKVGASIQNVYSYVIGVILNETDVEVLPDFEVLSVNAKLENFKTSIIHAIRNKEAAIAKDINIDIKVYHAQEKEPAHSFSRAGLEMAPNSIMELDTGWQDGNIKPGDYRSVIHLEQGGKVWDYEIPFTVEQSQAKELNEGNVNKAVSIFPVWMIVLIILFAVLLIVAIIVIILLMRKKKSDKNERTSC